MSTNTPSYFESKVFPDINTFNYDLAVKDFPTDVKGICISKDTTDLNQLNNYSEIRTINGFRLTKAQLDAIPTMPSVKHLMVEADCDSLSFLQKFPNLVLLHIDSFDELTSLEGIQILSNLQYLDIVGCKQITSINPIGELTQLKELRLEGTASGGMWKTGKLDALSKLTHLEDLHLRSISPPRANYKPLATLKSLKKLALPINAKVEDIALLHGALPETACYDFVPFQPFILDRYDKVRICGGTCKEEMINLTGKGKNRVLCPTCDKALIDAHVATYESWKTKGAALS